MAVIAKVGTKNSMEVRRLQMIHKLPQNGTFDRALESKVKEWQKKWGLPVNGYLDSATLAKYKATWPYAWGGSSSGGSPVIGGGGAAINGNVVETVTAGILLYGIFKVLMKVF